MQVLDPFAVRVVIDPEVLNQVPVVDSFRFPTQEFRSLALNIMAKLSTLDRGLWNRHKVSLCTLLLLYTRLADEEGLRQGLEGRQPLQNQGGQEGHIPREEEEGGRRIGRAGHQEGRQPLLEQGGREGHIPSREEEEEGRQISRAGGLEGRQPLQNQGGQEGQGPSKEVGREEQHASWGEQGERRKPELEGLARPRGSVGEAAAEALQTANSGGGCTGACSCSSSGGGSGIGGDAGAEGAVQPCWCGGGAGAAAAVAANAADAAAADADDAAAADDDDAASSGSKRGSGGGEGAVQPSGGSGCSGAGVSVSAAATAAAAASAAAAAPASSATAPAPAASGAQAVPPLPAGAPEASSLPPEFLEALDALVDGVLERDSANSARLLADDRIGHDQKVNILGKQALRRSALWGQVTSWCVSTSKLPNFRTVEPFLTQVLNVDPVPLFEQNGRDGSKTEDLMFQLMQAQLPPGWSLYSGARLLRVDNEPFPNQKYLKGEADLLLVDPDGVVQALLEVKTASGNLFLALYEDVNRLLALMDRVRGRRVTFSLSDSTRVTLQFSGHLKACVCVQPVYVLGCELAPGDVAAVARVAQGKLLTMEVGRLLSSRVGAWAGITVSELNATAVNLQVGNDTLPELRSNVHQYFETLVQVEIYALRTSAWSQRQALEADAVLDRAVSDGTRQAHA
ncbi:hypothetical protein FOA52_011385 [Chlamydomonas sp. UWO 241]|nr:hypothetical protein FOA52_011385 [Chlamydomonas sp. UWO 241]